MRPTDDMTIDAFDRRILGSLCKTSGQSDWRLG